MFTIFLPTHLNAANILFEGMWADVDTSKK